MSVLTIDLLSASQGMPMCKCEPVGLKWVFRFAIWLTDAPENARPHPKNTLRVFVYGDAAVSGLWLFITSSLMYILYRYSCWAACYLLISLRICKDELD
jgi:hypothetical protein